MESQLKALAKEIAALIKAHGPPSILLIDDEPMCFKLFSRFMDGCQITWATSGEIGLQMLADAKGEFDVVVVDERLPTIPGTEVIRIIRRDYPTLMTVLSTAYEYDDRNIRDKIKALGPTLPGLGTLFLPKPIQTSDLQALLAYIDGKNR